MQGWRVKWGHGARATLRLIPWREAGRVDAAVLRFARDGEGDIEWVAGSRSDLRLRVAPFVVLIEVDDEAEILRV